MPPLDHVPAPAAAGRSVPAQAAVVPGRAPLASQNA